MVFITDCDPMRDIRSTAPSSPQERAAQAVRAVLGRLARQKDLLLLDQISIEAVATDVSREVYRCGREGDQDLAPAAAP